MDGQIKNLDGSLRNIVYIKYLSCKKESFISTPMSLNWHCYHIVDMRPWPLVSSFRALFLTRGLVNYIYFKDAFLSLFGLVLLLVRVAQWWRDVSWEGSYQGLHTLKVQTNLRWGMGLFIAREVLFFFSFFWAYFHMSLRPTLEVGIYWPPVGVQPFNPFRVPLLNTLILLSSGVTVTWGHHSLVKGDWKERTIPLILTILLGVYFTIIQGIEYFQAPFTISDSVYGSCFFVATGFHGLHVLIGTRFLIVVILRIILGHFSRGHHFGFEAAAWYWHFVDVVWIFLFISIYWWGG